MNQKLRFGINGFGRIGRIGRRQIIEDANIEIVAINDIINDIDNLIYLYNYDSTYGKSKKKIEKIDESNVSVNQQQIKIHREKEIKKVDWQSHNVDILVDCSGVKKNILQSREIAKNGKVKIIFTNSCGDLSDKEIIMGINDEDLNLQKHKLISASICDANAISHILKYIDQKFIIKKGFITTLHPWLSYQNITDAPLRSQSNPSKFWNDFSLGRSSINNLIPKNTTAVNSLKYVLPDLEQRILGFSYRVPSSIVCSADISLQIQKIVKKDELTESLEKKFKNSPYVGLNYESLVSSDYVRNTKSCTIDLQWINVNDDFIKIVCWYDNEWGYSSRIIDLIKKIKKLEKII